MTSYLYNENIEEEFDYNSDEEELFEETENDFGRRKNEDEIDTWGYDDDFEDMGFN